MTEVKCEKCGRTLCELEGKVRIKCRKCGHMNYIVADTADQAPQGN
ncbi:phage FluMu protein Com [Anaerosolibacter carboniphilus]|uniref:Phage FluMu protein Com n=1 Tax=Anaerosolibacter carboniphilus TaxID=1417629 RepID=A0A841L4H4_9FIRM|nr:Com family DNA-binding transcriptional regulator [Anaerosolibacter carboniphilus]MBB6218012.1 phage FluMu protein Com [Anaerosolibacter carboniphilus]